MFKTGEIGVDDKRYPEVLREALKNLISSQGPKKLYYDGILPEFPSAKGLSEKWQHPAGRHCFERTIDKELYPPLSKTK